MTQTQSTQRRPDASTIPSPSILSASRRLSDHGLDPETLPVWLEGSHHKVPAAWLIERAGFRGILRTGEPLSSRHCLALINPGSATART